jgi:hypothetical protein
VTNSSLPGDIGHPPVHNETQWALLVSWQLWLQAGYVGLGSLAGGVDNPKRTFPLVVAALIPFVFFVVISPFLVSLSVDGNVDNYNAGYFSDLAKDVADRGCPKSWHGACGTVLAGAFSFAGIACMVCLYANTIITSEVSLQYFVEERYPTNVDSKGRKRRRSSLAQLPSRKASRCDRATFMDWMVKHVDGSAAPIYIIANGVMAMGMVLLPYKLLILFTMSVMGPSTLLFLGSFVALRLQEPNLQREFKLPGGTFMAVVMSLFPAVCHSHLSPLLSSANGIRSHKDFLRRW